MAVTGAAPSRSSGGIRHRHKGNRGQQMAKLLNTLRRFPSKKQSGKMHADASDKTWKIF